MEPARRPHLVSCPHCDASNPVNAFACWHCEHDLRERPPAVSEAPAGDTPVAADESPPAAPPSFFPVLREEVDGVAAHNDSIWEAAPSVEDAPFGASTPARGVPFGRLIVAALCGAAVASVVFLLGGRDGDSAPPPRAATVAAPVPTALVAEPVRDAAVPAREADVPVGEPPPPSVAPTAVPAPLAAVAPPRPTRSPRAEPRAEPASPRAEPVLPRAVDAAPARADRPQPAPVKGPCTPNVAALGLCSLDTP